MAKKRLIDIDKVKGFAIFLVVLGHMISGGVPKNNDLFIVLHQAIYRFHMPLFMFLSGVIFFYTYKPISNFQEYSANFKKKANRLLPGFFIIGFIILLGKFISSRFISVAEVDENLISGIISLLIDPSSSAAGSLWYIYVLFKYYMIFPLLLILFRKNLYVISFLMLVLFLIQAFYPITQLFLIQRFMQHAFFFSLGFIFVDNYESITKIFKKYSIIFILLFIASFSSREFIEGDFNRLVISIFSIPAVYCIVNFLMVGKKTEEYLLILAEYTFSIYLFNTIFIGLTKGVMFKFVSWDGLNLLFYIPILLFTGIVFSIWLQKYVLAKNTYLNKISK
jgi:fucose 4-O-acetylase-like acetyltransferase